ncbi:MAG: hypothetical protein ACRDWY_10180 [Actinomycetes bacterium]
MFAIAIVIVIVFAAVVARLVTVVRNDRSLTVPRSHNHELESRSAGLFRAV